MTPGGDAMAPRPADNRPYPGISFSGAVWRFFSKYATFCGRASRSEFWWAMLLAFAVSNALVGVTLMMPMLFALNGVWILATLIPSLAVYVRRLHDADKPGALVAVPYVLGVFGIALFATGLVRLLEALADAGGTDIMHVIGMLREVARSDMRLMVGSLVESGQFTASVVMIAAAFLLAVVAVVVWVAFPLLSSKPGGARFDR